MHHGPTRTAHEYSNARAGLPRLEPGRWRRASGAVRRRLDFHDLRHTGNNLTAAAGANLRELMARMGHSSTRAALICLHSTDERQREIADALGDLAAGQLKRRPGRARGKAAGKRSGTQRARRRQNAS